ncbi:hypothetical protein Cylst_2568 [Cylindrospermum stagnale PCC 7417]|uniref:Uncharacterized protein n=1 Tax=Cylindrospermum stagnale PCC 7417 TaxID=56107 RepID=K9WY76_9NOST|nr:hypothetical protein [Cylindrospermum stagnale]AFZ24774.1 hypothetical protein Cylst_2568 [Cylindrospermum stagnale PCC 7417]
MSEFSADLNNSSLWHLVYQELKEAPNVTSLGGYIKLPPFEVPLLLSSRLLIVQTASTIPAFKRWKWAGYLRAFQSIKGIKTEILQKSLDLNNAELIELPSFASTYSLILNSNGEAHWLRNLQLTIYEFTGEVENAITVTRDAVLDIKELIGG